VRTKRLVVSLLAGIALCFAAVPASAAKPAPTGEFTLQVDGYVVMASLSNMSHLTQNDEVTLGTKCVDAAGVEIVMWDTSTNNAGHNPYILETHWWGRYDRVATFTVPANAVVCNSQLIAADWFKGEVLKAWILDGPDTFTVGTLSDVTA